MSDPNSHTMPPLTNGTLFLTGDTRVKSVIYVNKKLPNHRFEPILTNSPLIAAISLALIAAISLALTTTLSPTIKSHLSVLTFQTSSRNGAPNYHP